MNTTVKGFAKINLYLDILSQRADGYHDIQAVFQSIDLHDTVTVKSTGGYEISIKGDFSIKQSENSAYKAAEYFRNWFNIKDGLNIEIEKGIPMAGGLGGSSADGAAVFKALSEGYGIKIDDKFIREAAFNVGADIPFMYYGGLAMVQGIGERVTPIEGRLGKPLVVGNPGIKVDTGWAYKATSFLLTPHSSTCNILLRCLTEVGYDAWNDALYNRFEDIVFNEHPQVRQLKTEFIENGAKAALMSGSGSSVYALFDSLAEAETAYGKMAEKWEWMRLVAAN